MMDRSSPTLPTLGSGITLLEADDRTTGALQSLVLDNLLIEDGSAVWVDSHGHGTTQPLGRIALSMRLLDRIRIARAFTPWQHSSLLRDLELAVTDDTTLVILPAFDWFYRSDDLGRGDGKRMLVAGIDFITELASEISEQVAIRLEHEAHYDWTAFVPLCDSDAGALTKYFGKVAGEDEYKYRGIECRQRSTPQYIDDAQKTLIRAVDEYGDPKTVCEELRSWVDWLERGVVDPSELVITNRVSKEREDYTQSIRSVAAIERAAELGLVRSPGQSVSYVVVDDAKSSRERVALASEELTEYDVGFYRELLVRAATSVLSPLGWRESDIEQVLG